MVGNEETEDQKAWVWDDTFRWLLTSLRMETRQGGEKDGEPEDRVITGWGNVQ